MYRFNGVRNALRLLVSAFANVGRNVLADYRKVRKVARENRAELVRGSCVDPFNHPSKTDKENRADARRFERFQRDQIKLRERYGF